MNIKPFQLDSHRTVSWLFLERFQLLRRPPVIIQSRESEKSIVKGIKHSLGYVDRLSQRQRSERSG